MKLTGKINRIIKFSNVDGPGNRMAIFFQGCNFNCDYCHNPETINICKKCYKCISKCLTNALIKNKIGNIVWDETLCCECDECIKSCKFDSSPKIKEYTIEEILQKIDEIKKFIKGITVSGGESTLHYEFITELFIEVKKRWPNLTCFVDTNGGVNLRDERYNEFVKNTDAFMLDVKAWEKMEHLELTSKDVNEVIENLYFLRDINKLFEVRTVIVSRKLDNFLTVDNVSKIIGERDIRYKIIKYRNFGVREDKKEKLWSPTERELEELAELARKNGVKNTLII